MQTRRSLLAAGGTGAAGLVGLAGCSAAPSGSSGAGAGEAGETGDDTADGDADDDTRIGFVGDLMLGRSVTDRWVTDENIDTTGVWGSTLSRLEALDGLVANLEGCISDRGERWPEKTYYFRAPPAFAVPALEAAGASFVSLANNHILDYREQGLRDTKTHLADAGIAHAGAGTDREAALEPTMFEAGDVRVAAFGLTDQSAAFASTDEDPGTAYATLDPGRPGTRALVEDVLDSVESLEPDLVVASLHWGPNWETEPRDVHERFGRFLVDRGVDVVHGHSAHVLQGVEVYDGSPLIYDAGDFVDDYVDYIDRQGVHNKRSALFELTVRDGDLHEIEVVPVHIVDEAATLAEGEVATWVRDTIAERSQPYGTPVEREDGRLTIPLGDSETAGNNGVGE